MKISQRILILVITNIIALLSISIIIMSFSALEKKYYIQSNRILDFQYTLSEKQINEKLFFSGTRNPDSLERLSFELRSKFSDIDPLLVKEIKEQLDKTEVLLSVRNEQLSALISIYLDQKNKQDSIIDLYEDYRIQSMAINVELESILTSSDILESVESGLIILYGANRELLSSVDQHIHLISGDFLTSPDEIDHQQQNLQKLSGLYSNKQYSHITGDLENLLDELLITGSEILQLRTQIREKRDEASATDEQIEILIGNIRNINSDYFHKKENQELFAIISGLLFITLFSILTTAILGRSIVVPIEQLKSYVLSTDISDFKPHRKRSIINKINAKKHVEIHQLADAYIKLETTLFNKMSELEDRSTNLSKELRDRKKAEKNLTKTEGYLNNILQSLNSIVITADKNLKLIHFNKQADELAIGSGIDIFNRFPFLTEFSTEITRVMENGEPCFKNSVLIDSHRERYFNISISALVGEETEGVVIRADDITSLRKIETQLIRTQKWETLGVLTSGFAHDFNNVLTGIVTSSSILLHKVETGNMQLEKSFTDCLKIIDRSGKRASAMVQQLLSLSKSNELTFDNIDLNQSVRDIESICRNSFDKSIDIEVELLQREIPVRADFAQIEQSLLNLCINSYHAMTDMREKNETPGGTLKISLREIHADNFNIHAGNDLKAGDYIAITISDTGIGISREQKKKIFDPFYTTKDKSTGTGLGLTMVQHIVNQHNGFINLYSEPGKGTVITVFIPVSRDISSEQPLTDKKRVLVEGSGTILIIDDEEVIRELSGAILEECGYSVLTAENGFDGVNEYRNNGDIVDLVILDMSMPGISGKETFIQLKQINPELKILMSSGFTKDDRIQDLINMGLEDFIQKPFDFIELSQKVSALIGI